MGQAIQQFLPLVLILGLVGLAIRHGLKSHFAWRKLPTLEAYLHANPECRTGNGIKCVNCGAKSIKNWGVKNAADRRRSFICNHCGSKLYRSA